ncbi:MAG: hypothetical protein U1E23_04930 [Reyranellaceae bacterium]
MGVLLKIILFGVAIYAAWRTVARWKGLWDRFVGGGTPPARPAPPPAQPSQPPPQQTASTAAGRPKVIDASTTCQVCGAWLSNAATRCERPDCPVG